MMKRLKVAYLVPALDYGGSETLLLTFLRFLDRSRFEPEVHCFYGDGKLANEFRAERIPVHEWRSRRRDPLAFFRLIRFLRRRGYDVVHTHLFDRQGRVAAYLAGIPVIVTTYHLVTDWDTTGGLSDRVKVFIDSLTSKLNDQIIVVSNDVKRNAIEKGGIDSSKIVTIVNGIDADQYGVSQDQGSLKADIGIGDSRIILCVGRLDEQKGHAYLVEAAELLRDRHPDVAVLIVGEGPLRGRLEGQIHDAGLEKTVRLLGERRDIARLLSIADLFVMPSLFEGLPIALLEAMASSRPIVATDVPGIRGVIDDGVDGLLVPPRDASALAKAIEFILGNGGRAASLGNMSGSKARKKYDIRLNVREVEELYRRLSMGKGVLD
jgi:glycosyltransferase involved in cell wall biosynthesis